MSKHNHNYTQYSNKPKVTVSEVKMESIPELTPEVLSKGHPDPVGAPGPMGKPGEPKMVDETVETKALPAMVEGHVAGCAKLNVRADASLFADVVCVLDVMSEIMIDVNKSTKDWLYVCTATGIEGYCMRKFVDARL